MNVAGATGYEAGGTAGNSLEVRMKELLFILFLLPASLVFASDDISVQIDDRFPVLARHELMDDYRKFRGLIRLFPHDKLKQLTIVLMDSDKSVCRKLSKVGKPEEFEIETRPNRMAWVHEMSHYFSVHVPRNRRDGVDANMREEFLSSAISTRKRSAGRASGPTASTCSCNSTRPSCTPTSRWKVPGPSTTQAIAGASPDIPRASSCS